jgi:hypothetical protein
MSWEPEQVSKADEMITLPSPRRIALLTGTAAVVGAVIVAVAVLPAEYGKDPTGLGQLTGISKLYAPPQVKVPAVFGRGRAAAQRSIEDAPAFRTDTVRIPLAAAGDINNGDKLEYKVRMPKGAALVYSWTVEGLPPAWRDNFMTQMHGHTLEDEETMTVVDYRLQLKDHDAGTLTAAIDGIHGWYVENRANVPVTMVVKLAGFYTLVPPGAPGNERGILAEGESAKP